MNLYLFIPSVALLFYALVLRFIASVSIDQAPRGTAVDRERVRRASAWERA